MLLVIYGLGVDRHTKTHTNKSYLKQPGIHRMPRFKIIHVCMLHMRLLIQFNLKVLLNVRKQVRGIN